MNAPLFAAPTSSVSARHTAVRGRARLHVLGLSGSVPLKHALECGLASAAGIRRVTASTVTGNVVVLFDPLVPLDAVTRRIEAIMGGGADAPEGAPPWHRLSAEEAARQLATSRANGLAADAASSRLARYGRNVLPVSPARSGLSILVEQMATLPVVLLGGAAALSLLSGGLLDAAVILGVVALNTGIGYVTESRTERVIRTLQIPGHRTAQVVRDGTLREIPLPEVVPGDLIPLQGGVIVPADARILHAQDLTVSEAALTGESQPVRKGTARLRRMRVPLAERTNMVFRGTIVTGGTGSAIVAATGSGTEVGHIQTLVDTAAPPETLLQRELGVLGRQLVLYSGLACAVVMLLGLLRGYGLVRMLKSAVSLAVAAVPEGLPTLATTALAIGIEEMRRHKVLIRHLAALETLAAVQVICFDKTGTLTLNRMVVADAECGGSDRRRLFEICVLCNDAEPGGGHAGAAANGSPTESALLAGARDAGLDPAELRQRHPRLAASYRGERRRFMMTVHRDGTANRLIAVKGSPADVLAMCDRQLENGQLGVLDRTQRLVIAGANRRMAARGLRVLGVAFKRMPAAGNGNASLNGRTMSETGNFVWVGLVGIADPARHGTAELMARFHAAGIRTIMLTGDQAATAQAIADAVGLGYATPGPVLDAAELDGETAPDFSTLARETAVFARVTPAQKLRIVEALQQSGAVVAMLGDGINDSPALRAADVGIALGAGGTEAARDIADIVLEDDDLATLVAAIERGRTTYANIRKAIRFLLGTNLSEIIVMLAVTATGLGPPLTALQLLWINLLSDVLPALGLAFEPSEPDVLRRPPRDPSQPILRAGDFAALGREASFIAAGSFAAMGYGLLRHGSTPRTGTVAFGSLVTAQLLHALTCRSSSHGPFAGTPLPSNRVLGGALALSFALQAAVLTLPPLRRLLGLTAIDAIDAAAMLGAGLLPYLANEAMKRGSDPADDG